MSKRPPEREDAAAEVAEPGTLETASGVPVAKKVRPVQRVDPIQRADPVHRADPGFPPEVRKVSFSSLGVHVFFCFYFIANVSCFLLPSPAAQVEVFVPQDAGGSSSSHASALQCGAFPRVFQDPSGSSRF